MLVLRILEHDKAKQNREIRDIRAYIYYLTILH